jgi:hypothetical protein
MFKGFDIRANGLRTRMGAVANDRIVSAPASRPKGVPREVRFEAIGVRKSGQAAWADLMDEGWVA